MYKPRNKKNNKNTIPLIKKILLGFLLPYITINGIIFFLYIQSPKINVIDTNSNDYEENKIKFTIESTLPITNIKVYFQDQEIPYTKFGAYYTIDAKDNGSYQIVATSLNKSSSNSYINIETIDSNPPIINTADASISGDTLSVTISDEQTGINYDNVYGINEDESTVEPNYVDKASGTIQFDFENKTKLTIHVEDLYGNSTEATFNAG